MVDVAPAGPASLPQPSSGPLRHAGRAAHILAIFATIVLAACGPKPPAPQPSVTEVSADRAAAPHIVSLRGLVKAVDLQSGRFTVEQAASREMAWESYTVEYRVPPAMLADVAVGKTIGYELEVGSGGFITAIDASPTGPSLSPVAAG